MKLTTRAECEFALPHIRRTSRQTSNARAKNLSLLIGPPTTRRRGATNVRVFGSVCRAEERPDSDVGFLVDLDEGRSLLDLGGLLMDLQEFVGCPVDVVTEKGLAPRIRERVLGRPCRYAMRDYRERLLDIQEGLVAQTRTQRGSALQKLRQTNSSECTNGGCHRGPNGNHHDSERSEPRDRNRKENRCG